MSRKKSRKVGQIGIRSVPKDQRKTTVSPAKPKKKLGNPSGSRHSAKQDTTNNAPGSQPKDPRVGSKKAVPLIVEAKSQPKQAKPKYFSPKHELKAIEDDEKLANLLDRVDNGYSLKPEQQKYVDEKLARHRQLCDLLGIEVEEPEEESSFDEEDPFSRFEAIDPNKLS